MTEDNHFYEGDFSGFAFSGKVGFFNYNMIANYVDVLAF